MVLTLQNFHIWLKTKTKQRNYIFLFDKMLFFFCWFFLYDLVSGYLFCHEPITSHHTCGQYRALGVWLKAYIFTNGIMSIRAHSHEILLNHEP